LKTQENVPAAKDGVLKQPEKETNGEGDVSTIAYTSEQSSKFGGLGAVRTDSSGDRGKVDRTFLEKIQQTQCLLREELFLLTGRKGKKQLIRVNKLQQSKTHDEKVE